MKINRIEKIKYDNPIPVYDVVLATPNNNFLIKTNTNYIVSHNCGILDEINFVKGSNIDYTKSKIMDTYTSVKRRMQSRFTFGGVLQAKLFLVSSKKSEQDFVESYIETVKDEKEVFISDEPQWNVKPEGTFSDKRFYVAVGDKKLNSRIVRPGEDLEAIKQQGYRLLAVPLELKKDFERDVDRSLMEFAGISTSLVTKFISYDSIDSAKCSSENPFTNNVISIGTSDSMLIQDFFSTIKLDSALISKPMFIHIDTSLTGDKTGISGVWVIGLREEQQYQDGEYAPVHEFVYKHAFTVEIQCPTGDEISLEKNRKFIYWLRHRLGLNIQGVSLDGFQSADSKQQFIQAGFNASIISLDKKPDGYMYLKASINEKRIRLLNNTEEIYNQLINLEQNNQTGKVDHPPEGEKDGADSLAGALYNASLNVDPLELNVVEDYTTIVDTNEDVYITPEDKYLAQLQSDITSVPKQEEQSVADLMSTELDNMQHEQEIKEEQDKRLKQLRSTMTRQENATVTDDELENAFFSHQDDNMLIF